MQNYFVNLIRKTTPEEVEALNHKNVLRLIEDYPKLKAMVDLLKLQISYIIVCGGSNPTLNKRVKIPRINISKKQQIETLVSEEASLFAMYLRNEKKNWKPRLACP